MKILGFGPATLAFILAMTFLCGTLALVGYFADKVGPQHQALRNREWVDIPPEEAKTYHDDE